MTHFEARVIPPKNARQNHVSDRTAQCENTAVCAAACPDKYSKTHIFLLILDMIKKHSSQV